MDRKDSVQWDYDPNELRHRLGEHIVKQFHVFASHSALPKGMFGLDHRLTGLAITNAVSDMTRSVRYHSTSGPSIFKVAGFVSKWIAHQRPIWVNPNRPINLHSAALDSVNSVFAAGVAQSLLSIRMYPKLASDLRYCLEFRRMTGDDINLLLEHALRWSPSAVQSFAAPMARAS